MKNYTALLEKEQLEALREISKNTGATIQWQIRKAIDDYISAHNLKAKKTK